MKFSSNWLKKHINPEVLAKISLPGESDSQFAQKIATKLTMQAFEVEEVIDLGYDSVLDVKVLPDRSHDALSHRGMAREITSLYSQNATPVLAEQAIYAALPKTASLTSPKIIIKDTVACLRFMAIRVSNIEVKPSSEETKKLLEAIGQKSINNVVDATNYVLYDLGKPMHVFDADKVVGAISARLALPGEKLVTLDGKDIELDETMLVIADKAGPLSVAGIKGGSRAQVDVDTTNIIIESANFNGSLLRKISAKVGIKTDASRRFENGLTSELCPLGLLATLNLILNTASTEATQVSEVVDVYPKKEMVYKVGVSTSEVNKLLGTKLTDEQVGKFLMQRGFSYELKLVFQEITRLSATLPGAPYKRGASVLYDAPRSFDCSSLSAYMYKEAGIAIPRIAIDQYVFSYPRTGEPQVGDLVFTNTGIEKTNSGGYYSQVLSKMVAEQAVRNVSVEWLPGTQVDFGVDHVGVYIGDAYVLHANSGSGQVQAEKLADSIFARHGYSIRYVLVSDEQRFVVEAPSERLDIRIKEDLIDEIGKLLGTQDLAPTTLYSTGESGKLARDNYFTALVRETLIKQGFSEVITSSFSGQGDIGIINSVDPKKNKLRTKLIPGITSALAGGLYNADFLEIKNGLIQVFEIGKVFNGQTESLHLAIGLASKDKKLKKTLPDAAHASLELLSKLPGTPDTLAETTPQESYELALNDEIAGTSCLEIDLAPRMRLLPEYALSAGVLKTVSARDVVYQTLSNYPCITRDVAFFADEGNILSIEQMIKDQAGELCIKVYQFDRFHKQDQDKVSFGYRCIFQSMDRTLSDVDIELPMSKIHSALAAAGCQVR